MKYSQALGQLDIVDDLRLPLVVLEGTSTMMKALYVLFMYSSINENSFIKPDALLKHTAMK